MNDFDNVQSNKLILIAGEVLEFYHNSAELDDSPTFDQWKVDLYFADGNSGVGQLALSDILTLSKDIISGSDYRWYGQFNIPTDLTNGVCYRMVITDAGNYNNVIFVSSELLASSIREFSEFFKYRNTGNILNYNYEGLPSFNNQFRIPIVRRAPTPTTEKKGYPISSGAFLATRSIIGKNEEFITQWFDDLRHEGFNAATIHNLMFIFVEGEFRLYERPSDSDYSLDWQERYPLTEGVITLQRKDTFSSNKAR